MAKHEHYYYDNGESERESVEIHDEQRHGITQRWYNNSQCKSEHYFRHGQLHGTMRGWSKSGRLTYKNYYLHGRRVTQTEYEARGEYEVAH